MSYEHLRGRRFINLVRCSTDEQADTSPADQAALLCAFGREHGLIHAGGDVVLEGVTGSMPGARDDLDLIRERKMAADDFDVLLVQDSARLTRGGTRHGNAVIFALGTAGVDVVCINEHSTGDEEQDAVFQTLGFWAAQKMAKDLSFAATRGQMSSLANGFIPHTSRIPYGVDRLYVGLDGKPRHRIRNLPDGTQQLLRPDEEIVVTTYAKSPKKGASLHYKRQSDERIVLVPGAPECVAAVRQMYRRHLRDGWGCHRIARELNDACLPSPTGKDWGIYTVESILNNGTYAGAGVSDRYAKGIYYIRGGDKSPKPAKLSTQKRTTCRKAPIRLRPREDWKFQPHPLLVDYLGAELRDLAVARHEREFAKQAQKAVATSKPLVPHRDKHGDSAYVLKGLLKARGSGAPMTGKLSGPTHNRTRYHTVGRAWRKPKTGSASARLVPAEAVERAVLSVVQDVLTNLPDLRSRLAGILDEQLAALDGDRRQLEPLLAEQAELSEKLQDALTLGPASRRSIQGKLDQWESRLLDLEGRIDKVRSTSSRPSISVDDVAERIRAKLSRIATSLEEMPPATVRTLLASVIGKLEVDQVTRELTIELCVDDESLGSAVPMGLVEVRPSPCPNETHRPGTLKIASVRCEHHRVAQKPCFRCSRMAA